MKGSLIKADDWAKLEKLNPPLIEKIIKIGEDSARIINQVYSKDELKPKDIKEAMRLRENSRSLKTVVTALSNNEVIEDFEGVDEIKEDLEKYDKQVEKMEKKQGIRALSKSNYMYAIVEKIGSLMRVLYHVIEETKKKFLARIGMSPKQVQRVKDLYNRLLRKMRILANYYVALNPSDENTKRLVGFYKRVRDFIGIYPLQEVLPLEDIEGNHNKTTESLSISNVIEVTTGNYDSIDSRALSIYIRQGNHILDKMLGIGRVNVRRSLFGLGHMDVLYYYTSFFVELKKRSPWTVELPSREELVQKARIEKGGGEGGGRGGR